MPFQEPDHMMRWLYFVTQFILLRFKQLFRLISQNGAGALLLLPFMALLLIIAYTKIFQLSAWWQQGILLLLLVSINTQRQDIRFLLHLKTAGRMAFLFEQLLGLTLAEMPFFVTGRISYLVALPYGTVVMLWLIMPVLQLRLSTGFVKKITAYLPLMAFDWRFGLRRQWPLFLFSYLLAFVLLFFIPILPFFYVFWAAYAGDLCKQPENKEMIQAGRSARGYLHTRLRTTLLVTNSLFLPHLLLSLFLYHGWELLYLAAGFLVFNLVTVFVLTYRYAKYNPQIKHPENGFPLVLYLFSLPILPLSLYIQWSIYQQAIRNTMRYFPSAK
jgi:hypothetical protein